MVSSSIHPRVKQKTLVCEYNKPFTSTCDHISNAALVRFICLAARVAEVECKLSDSFVAHSCPFDIDC